MTKWADYLISAVRFSETETKLRYVSEVQVREDKIGSIGFPPETWSKDKVITLIQNGYSFKTIVLNDFKQWDEGKRVEISLIESEFYLKTLGEANEKDQLENLPTY